MKKAKTPKGMTLYTFTDCYGGPCSLQKSSSEVMPYVWLGLDYGADEGDMGKRMLLDRKLAAKLSKKLAGFADTGEI